MNTIGGRATSSCTVEIHGSTVFVLSAAAALLAAYDLYLLALANV